MAYLIAHGKEDADEVGLALLGWCMSMSLVSCIAPRERKRFYVLLFSCLSRLLGLDSPKLVKLQHKIVEAILSKAWSVAEDDAGSPEGSCCGARAHAYLAHSQLDALRHALAGDNDLLQCCGVQFFPRPRRCLIATVLPTSNYNNVAHCQSLLVSATAAQRRGLRGCPARPRRVRRVPPGSTVPSGAGRPVSERRL
jgi:hypothetical protein